MSERKKKLSIGSGVAVAGAALFVSGALAEKPVSHEGRGLTDFELVGSHSELRTQQIKASECAELLEARRGGASFQTVAKAVGRNITMLAVLPGSSPSAYFCHETAKGVTSRIMYCNGSDRLPSAEGVNVHTARANSANELLSADPAVRYDELEVQPATSCDQAIGALTLADFHQK